MKEVKNLTDTTTRDKSKDGLKLERVFGVWDATAHIIGNIIGSGIFVSPKVNEKGFKLNLQGIQSRSICLIF